MRTAAVVFTVAAAGFCAPSQGFTAFPSTTSLRSSSFSTRQATSATTSRHRPAGASSTSLKMSKDIDLTGKVAFVAGVADSSGYGWAICKALAEAGATVTVGTWPPVLGIFQKSLNKGSFDEDMKLEDGSKFEIAKVYPLDAVYDVPEDVPEDVKTNKRYAGLSGFTIQEVADQIKADYGQTKQDFPEKIIEVDDVTEALGERHTLDTAVESVPLPSPAGMTTAS